MMNLTSMISSDAEAPPKSISKSMVAFRKTWGIEWVIKIFEAYSHLQVLCQFISTLNLQVLTRDTIFTSAWRRF